MIYPYNRRLAVEYAVKWAFMRNPLFYDFSDIGGNCTNFVSQCILAGCCTMNFTRDVGWYYISSEDRAASWTGVQFLYDFLTSNRDAGPFGIGTDTDDLQIGDVIQLADEDGSYYHSLLVTGFNGSDPLVAAQSFDAFNRPLSSYSFARSRGIHVFGYRRYSERCDCFDGLYNGTDLSGCL